jgi:phosphoglycolate phosphatase
MIRVVTFDFDGTLVDSNRIKVECMRQAVAGLERGAEALQEALALGGDRYRIFVEVARRLDPAGTPGAVARRGRALAADYGLRCARAIRATRERRGGRSVLATLRQRGLRVWVASATPQRDLLPILRARGVLPFLRGALGGPASKVDNLRRIMRVERAAAREMLLVGDSPDDHEAARRLGVWFVAVTAENRLPGPHRFAMRDLTGLAALVARLRSRVAP